MGAGATLAAVQDAARDAGFDAGLDFAARDSCTIGGVVACNAGEPRALPHGTARGRVAGLEAVLADGSVITRMAGLTKDNAGYDLPSLLVGSENKWRSSRGCCGSWSCAATRAWRRSCLCRAPTTPALRSPHRAPRRRR